MFEARLTQASLLKKLVDALKELIQEANFNVSNTGMCLQAMDTSHVCLVAFMLREDGFDGNPGFRCDRDMSLGMHLTNLSKILKCAANDDSVTLKAEDDGDVLSLTFESPSHDRSSNFDLKLMDIDAEHLGIPDQEYAAEITMSASEYQRICRDLATIGDTVQITATKNGVKFSTSGDVGTASITLKQNTSSEKAEEHTRIQLNEAVSLTFALRYLNNFAKATPLASQVKLSLAKDIPIVVEYQINDIGFLKYYLAPKIEDNDEGNADDGDSN
uniref:DNA sliding clamp PCNA n=1 Tax=Polytomella parva TaxID=51329 RepID=A0A6U0TM54_9CHLO|mmetsp:Transcript_13006/g.23131  ORF Transcript_13006/g.23131 Transcript_13006/m.23131 type:complete len:273 (-) Transcript_13006:1204-2022(-)|eukprot:CAMPEP_0175055850 /NCGR_PEP_ID=MMETSP0052_2-20121109/10320_1 /TAXON_ID=51329 ORGANISM="Polytomella parva, Strain SAG 63-3" /NCGR_SAMPLE_ID=MMETSP0052_2 /ASSEMBLY_ACC=CAM_ASM_000194 /LENGTH=272 /DNA_ID=CAMNT_0016320763 /DNA_START=36 /DNA_END=854 /DNA_ORIENTATION=+